MPLPLETDNLSWWDGLHSSMTLMGYAIGSLYSWQVQPCWTGYYERVLTKFTLLALQVGGWMWGRQPPPVKKCSVIFHGDFHGGLNGGILFLPYTPLVPKDNDDGGLRLLHNYFYLRPASILNQKPCD